MEVKNGINTLHAKTQDEWRIWLEKNHLLEKSIWLIIYKKSSAIPSIYYPEAVDEALCFGWIDSKANKRDEESYYQFFTKRNPKSNWSKINKEKVAKLLELSKMAPAGLKTIDIAKQNGTWNALDEVDQLIVPNDLQKLLDENQLAKDNWEKFPPSSRRGILEWILNAKQDLTRQKRIIETVVLAEKNIKANHSKK